MSGKKPSDADTVSMQCARLLVNAGHVAKKAGSTGTCTSKELLAKVKGIPKPENLDQALVKDFEELEQRIALLEEQNKVLEERNKVFEEHNKVLEEKNKELELRLHPSDNQGPVENHFSAHVFSAWPQNEGLIERLAKIDKQYKLLVSRENQGTTNFAPWRPHPVWRNMTHWPY